MIENIICFVLNFFDLEAPFVEKKYFEYFEENRKNEYKVLLNP